MLACRWFNLRMRTNHLIWFWAYSSISRGKNSPFQEVVCFNLGPDFCLPSTIMRETINGCIFFNRCIYCEESVSISERIKLFNFLKMDARDLDQGPFKFFFPTMVIFGTDLATKFREIFRKKFREGRRIY